MKECCREGSCSTEKMGHECHSCNPCKCHCEHKKVCNDGNDNECESRHIFLKVADHAWMEVLKDKIKDQILASEGHRMTELAKLIAESNSERWKHRASRKKCCKEFREKLCGLFEKSPK